MAQNIPVIIIDPDKESAQKIEKHLRDMDRHISYAGYAGNPEDGHSLIIKTRPMIVIMEIDSDPENSFALVSKVLQQFPGTCFFATSSDPSSENILRAMRGGCSEFLLRPVASVDLMNALHKFGRIIVQQQPSQVRSENGRIITVFSPKGGMGTSTVAANLAVSMHLATKKSVVLVDLDLESGDASMFLNLKTRYSISDVTSNIARLDRSFVEGVLAKHSSGVYLMAEPEKIEEAESITAAQVREVITLLRNMFNYVIIDTGIGYDEVNLSAFDAADMVLLVGVQSLPAVRNMQKALDVFERLGYSRDKVKLIINRFLKKSEITVEDTQKTLNYDVFWRIPNDFNNVMTSINRGMPLGLLAPGSEISKSFKDLATASQSLVDKMHGISVQAGNA
jgi:pilus assembly protein CpaE